MFGTYTPPKNELPPPPPRRKAYARPQPLRTHDRACRKCGTPYSLRALRRGECDRCRTPVGRPEATNFSAESAAEAMGIMCKAGFDVTDFRNVTIPTTK